LYTVDADGAIAARYHQAHSQRSFDLEFGIALAHDAAIVAQLQGIGWRSQGAGKQKGTRKQHCCQQRQEDEQGVDARVFHYKIS
jgi:hypothetical protein